MPPNHDNPHDVTWAACRADFEFDGSLRDIYVEDTSRSDWAKLISTICRHYRHVVREPHRHLRLPEDLDSLLKPGVAASAVFDVGGMEAATHFFTVRQIEFDIDPRRVDDEDAFKALLGFMRCIGTALSKRVLLSEENGIEFPILIYDPQPDRCRRAEISESPHQ